MSHPTSFQAGRRTAAAGATALLMALTSGCADLRPKSTAPPKLHTLDARSAGTGPVTGIGALAGPTLVVTVPGAAAGLDGRQRGIGEGAF